MAARTPPSAERPRANVGLAVRAVGLGSPLGGTVSAAAAARAGITRPAPAPDELQMAVGENAPSPLSIHALRGPTFGFHGLGRLVALLDEAVVDLRTQVDLATLGRDVGTFVAMPDPEEREELFGVDPSDLPEDVETRMTAAATDLLTRAGQARNVDLVRGAPVRGFAGGQCAFASACAAAAAAIAGRQLRGALVVAIDSLSEPLSLQVLGETDRLKSGDNPVGFIPGEAAAIVYLSSPREPGPPPLAIIEAIAARADAWKPGDEGGPDGTALAGTVTDALATAPLRAPGGPALMVDNDGETWRAHELAMALLRLRAKDQRFAGSHIWRPATSFGNVGAAFGGLALALATRAFARKYAPGPSFLLLSSAEQGGRAVLSVGSGQE